MQLGPTERVVRSYQRFFFLSHPRLQVARRSLRQIASGATAISLEYRIIGIIER